MNFTLYKTCLLTIFVIYRSIQSHNLWLRLQSSCMNVLILIVSNQCSKNNELLSIELGRILNISIIVKKKRII